MVQNHPVNLRDEKTGRQYDTKDSKINTYMEDFSISHETHFLHHHTVLIYKWAVAVSKLFQMLLNALKFSNVQVQQTIYSIAIECVIIKSYLPVFYKHSII